jgi:DNA polymerase-3 subunit delta'
MPILPLHGHAAVREKLLARVHDASLPASLLLHGAAGTGKQRLALWLAQALLCERENSPCGECQHCRYSVALSHPDLHWIFPRQRLKPGASPDDFGEDLAQAIAERTAADGLYPRPPGNEGIFIPTMRLVVRQASLTPALARRKVFVIGDAERMVPQEGSDEAANAFLKLLEEPPADTWIILTSSQPAALLPTIRSRVVSVRILPLAERDVRAFLDEPAVAARLGKAREKDALLAEAGGAPGRLLSTEAEAKAVAAARKLVDAALDPDPSLRYEAVFTQSVSGARGAFSDTLDALTLVLAERTRDAVRTENSTRARALTRAIDAVETAKDQADGNVNPQLVTWKLLTGLGSAR